MADPWVREIGRVEIPGGPSVVVSINHGAVDIGRGEEGYDGRLTVPQADELAALLITACWMASAHPCPADCGEPVHDETCRPVPS
jgi:hypothetical protein